MMIRPLKHKRILITREKSGAEVFANKLKERGAVPIITPLLTINCLKTHFFQTAATLSMYEWIFFTSANGVDCFFKHVQKEDVRSCRIAAVGSKTAKALEKHGCTVHFIPNTFHAEAMAREFFQKYTPSRPVLFVRGNRSRRVLIDRFLEKQIPFDCLHVYETMPNQSIQSELNRQLQQHQFDFLTFTSPSTVDSFIQLTEEAHRFLDQPIVCIGPTTKKRAKEHGFANIFVPEQYTIEGMIDTMQLFTHRKDE